MTETPQTPTPARELNTREILAAANEMSIEAALKKRNAQRIRTANPKDHRAWFLSREAEALERWAFRLTQTLP